MKAKGTFSHKSERTVLNTAYFIFIDTTKITGFMVLAGNTVYIYMFFYFCQL